MPVIGKPDHVNAKRNSDTNEIPQHHTKEEG